MPAKARNPSLAWGLWHLFWLVLLTVVLGTVVILLTFLSPGNPFPLRLGRVWGRTLLCLSRVPVRVTGLEELAPGQTYVFAANHRSNFDIFVLLAVLPGKFLWVAKKSLFKIPIFGQALSRIGCVAIDRSDHQAAIRSLDQAVEVMGRGFSMIIFPEGTRGTTGELLPFKKGVFIMALKAEQPVVPVSISGTLFIQPRGSLRVRPGPVRVVISPPLDPRDFPRKEGLMEAVRQAIAKHYDPDFPYGPGPRV
jgi:1-acyl-sn-glycerol-3-phosphate acyltransferase